MKAEVFRDDRQEFRWRIRAANGKIVGTSGEGYRNFMDCLNGLSVVCRWSSSGGENAVADVLDMKPHNENRLTLPQKG